MINDLSNKLKGLRINRKESLQDTANAVGVTKTHIWELEKGKSANPSAELLSKLADHYGVTIDYLLNPSKDSLTEEEKALVFYRDLKKLEKEQQEIIFKMIKMFKGI